MFKIGDIVQVQVPSWDSANSDIYCSATITDIDMGNVIYYSAKNIDGQNYDIFGCASLLDLCLWNSKPSNVKVNMCVHEWYQYVGFTDIYNYCAKCNVKE